MPHPSFDVRSLRGLPRIRPPHVRTTYVFQGLVPAMENADAQRAAIAAVLNWVEQKYTLPLPDQARHGESFVSDVTGGSAKVEVIALPQQGIWSLRFLHGDMPYLERPAVPGRMWTTQVGLRRHPGGAASVVVQVGCATPRESEAPIVLTRPGVVKSLAERVGLSDIRPVSKKAWRVDTEAELAEFVAFLLNPERQMAVHVWTPLDPGKQFEFKAEAPVPVDADHHAATMQGLAHVVVLGKETARKLSSAIGRVWSVFGGAMRTYRPGVDIEDGSPYEHPLVMPDKMFSFSREGQTGVKAFVGYLEQRARDWTASRRVHDGYGVLFDRAQLLELEEKRGQARDAALLETLIDEQALTYRAQLSEKDREIDSLLEQLASMERDLDFHKNDLRKARAAREAQRVAFKQLNSGEDGITLPTVLDYDGLAEWVDEALSGRLVLAPRAVRALKDAAYESPSLVFECLLHLATDYRDMRLGYEGARERWEQALMSRGVELGGSIAKENAGAQRDEYFIKWPPNSDTRAFMELALKKGSNKDQRYTLRIYFFWDEESSQVVVGWLPSHLTNRMT